MLHNKSIIKWLTLTEKCEPGSYHMNDTCEACPLGSYQPEESASACIPCDSGLTTVESGSTSLGDCVSHPLEGKV